MDAALVLQLAVDAASLDRRDDFLQAADVGVAARHHLDPPPLPLGELAVHPEELGREKPGLVAAGAGADFEHDILRVVRILRDEQDLQVGEQRVALRVQGLQFFPREVAHVRIAAGDEPFGLGDVVHGRLVLAEALDERLDFGERLGELPVLGRIALHLGRAEPAHQFFVSPFFRCQFVEHTE